MNDSTVHRCSRCHQPNRIPTIEHTPTVEKAPPKRGDPIPAPVDGPPRACVHCGARTIPRAAFVAPRSEPVPDNRPPTPPRGTPIPTPA